MNFKLINVCLASFHHIRKTKTTPWINDGGMIKACQIITQFDWRNNTDLTHNLQNFFNGLVQFSFLEVSIIYFGDVKIKI
jgi:hypothetical protein